MCGIAGIVSTSNNALDLRGALSRMTRSLIHRGPDDGGEWWDDGLAVGLGHRRLSILDLSPAGHQPMQSACGRFVIVFNGEIYNHLEIRDALSRQEWRGHSDTETLLAAIAQWGLRRALQAAVGMFAFALWDRQDKKLTLARDRFGEKPLYYGEMAGLFLFASELKAIKAAGLFDLRIDRNALQRLMKFNYIPAPYSIYENVYKLTPGSYLEIDGRQLGGRNLSSSTEYWSLSDVVHQARLDPFSGSELEATEQLDQLLRQSVKRQMISDVPLGAFLSGGVDSSAIVALMQAQSSRPVRTFTIGFREEEFNEARHAAAVARHLGTDHVELYVDPKTALSVIPKLPQMFDEPFSDSSQIPTFLVAQLARSQVTVSLSGDAGDELFGGYNRYVLAEKIWHRIARLPRPLRQSVARAIEAVAPTTWNGAAGIMRPLLPKRLQHSSPGDKLHKLAGILALRTPEELYDRLLSHWENPAALVIGANSKSLAFELPPDLARRLTFTERMMLIDSLAYLPDDILVKVDRSAMSISLETRVPFLDHNIAEFAWRLPQSMKIDGGEGKKILRNVLYRYVPRTLIDRPKMGFGVPIEHWLRGELRDWAEALLNRDRLLREGYFEPQIIRDRWDEHLSGQRNWHYYLWDVLMFQAWLEQQRH